jgi:glutamate-1-semialdehyde 2,1-aminomutase
VTVTVKRSQLEALVDEETRLFVERHPRSLAAFSDASLSLLEGVPMPWMTEWASPYPPFVADASGASFTDLDGHSYVDFCLGDTAAMAGHSPPAVAEAVATRVRSGITLMLPTADAAWVGEELARRFGVPWWQFALSATDANRFVIRLARHLTGRPKVLVFNWCYHGSVDETLAVLEDGQVHARPQNIGPPVAPALTTIVVEWNDLAALAAALESGEIACVLTEPALTNIGIVPPDDGFHESLRELTHRHGTFLVIDETHTVCCGPGGYTRAFGLKPDFITIGKAIAGGIPAAAYGMSDEVAERMTDRSFLRGSDVGGIGGTLAGNALSLAAARATLEHVLTDQAFESMVELASAFQAGVAAVIHEYDRPWHVTQLGCRAEYWFCPSPPRNGAEAAAAADPLLDRYFHLYLLNRGVLMTPFHNMALMSPATKAADVDRHTSLFADAVEMLHVRTGTLRRKSGGRR